MRFSKSEKDAPSLYHLLSSLPDICCGIRYLLSYLTQVQPQLHFNDAITSNNNKFLSRDHGSCKIMSLARNARGLGAGKSSLVAYRCPTLDYLLQYGNGIG